MPLKRFTPDPEPEQNERLVTPEPTGPDTAGFTRKSVFSPFADKDKERKRALGEPVYGVKPDKPALTDTQISEAYERATALLGGDQKRAITALGKLVGKYMLIISTPRRQREGLAELMIEVEELVGKDNVESQLIVFAALAQLVGGLRK